VRGGFAGRWTSGVTRMPDACPSCAAPVLATPSGLLDPDPTRLGVLKADGTGFTKAEVVAAWRTPQGHLGHHRHKCATGAARARTRGTSRPEPNGPPGQDSLFAIPDTADKTRSRRP